MRVVEAEEIGSSVIKPYNLYWEGFLIILTPNTSQKFHTEEMVQVNSLKKQDGGISSQWVVHG